MWRILFAQQKWIYSKEKLCHILATRLWKQWAIKNLNFQGISGKEKRKPKSCPARAEASSLGRRFAVCQTFLKKGQRWQMADVLLYLNFSTSGSWRWTCRVLLDLFSFSQWGHTEQILFFCFLLLLIKDRCPNLTHWGIWCVPQPWHMSSLNP